MNQSNFASLQSYAPLNIPENKIRLYRAINLYHSGHEDYSGLDWAKEMRDRNHKLRRALSQGAIKSWLIQEDGCQVSIPAWNWDGHYLWSQAYETCLIKVQCEKSIENGYILIEREEFDRLILNIPTSSLGAEQQDGYLPIYVKYMLDLIWKFDLADDYDFDRRILTEWVKNNPSYVGKISGANASKIVTYVGNPKYDRGGNKSQAEGKRSNDPTKPYRGVTYPKMRPGEVTAKPPSA